MPTPQTPRKRLPESPSEENLRKQAKQLAKEEGLQLAAAQRRLAIEYGYRTWAELIRAVASPLVPLIPLRGLVAFPHEVYPIYVGRPKSIGALDAVAAGARVLLVTQRDARVAEPGVGDMYEVGTLCSIVRQAPIAGKQVTFAEDSAKIMVEGLRRARVIHFVLDKTYLKAEVEEITETADRSDRAQTLTGAVLSAVAAYADRTKKAVPVVVNRTEVADLSVLPYKIARHLNLRLEEQQALLETVSAVERAQKILGYLEAAI